MKYLAWSTTHDMVAKKLGIHWTWTVDRESFVEREYVKSILWGCGKEDDFKKYMTNLGVYLGFTPRFHYNEKGYYIRDVEFTDEEFTVFLLTYGE